MELQQSPGAYAQMTIEDKAVQDYAMCLVVLCSLETTITDAVLTLQRKEGDENEFVKWAKKPLKKVTDELLVLARKVATGDFFQELHGLSNACAEALELKKWRNRHVHARARLTHGNVIFLLDKDGQPFRLESEQFHQVTIRAIEAQSRIISTVDVFKNVLEFGDEVELAIPDDD